MTPAVRLTAVAVATQSGLGVAGLVAARAAGVPVRWGLDHPVTGLVSGLGVAALLAAANYRWLHAPTGVFARVRTAVDEVLVPTFASLTPPQIVVVSLAAGVGEELFFRGWLQAVVGWLPASLAFGLAHVAGARMLAFGVWATVMGAVLGGLALGTGGLLAPMTAHACYDMLAFQYLGSAARWRAAQGV
ncbi:MAG: CPBP family intramembrane metalloprotease [Acidobacteria bacterium]|nr:CPBP family intramembrane metalloprotease [Acidobacteriota bacterium]